MNESSSTGTGPAKHRRTWLAWLLLLPCGVSLADEVYKCVAANGATTFTSRIDPQKHCEQVELKVIQPNPDDVARTLEKSRQKEEQDKMEEKEERERQAARAQVLEAEAAMRRARAAEEENRLLRQQQELNSGYNPTYPSSGILYPYPVYPPHYPPLPPHPPMPREPHPPQPRHDPVLELLRDKLQSPLSNNPHR